MAYNRKQRRTHEQKSQFYGFGALGVTPVRLNGIDETWQNPNLDTTPFLTHQPAPTRRPSSAKYPNFKYSKSKKRKKKKCKKQSLLYYHHNNDIHTAAHPPISPRKHTLSRPASARNAAILRPTKPSHSASLHNIQPVNEQNIKNDSESIQFELMKEHMFSLKQQITKSINTNQEIIIHQTQNNELPKKKKKYSKKAAIFVPTPSSLLCVEKRDSVRMKMSHSPIQNAPAFGSPKRPKHQSFQRPMVYNNDHQCVGNKNKLKIKSPNSNQTKIINQKQNIYKHVHKYKKTKKRFHGIPQKKHIYDKRPQTAKPITLQSQLHKVNVGLSSTFASNTPRIVPLNKLMANPKFQIYKNVETVIKTTKRKTKKRVRPWSSKPKKTTKYCKKIVSKRSKKRSKKSHAKKRRNRPKSAPANHRRHDTQQYASMQSYMQRIESNADVQMNDNVKASEELDDSWNPFTGITMFELQYLISFLRKHQSEYHLCDEILDVLDKCLHFYVRNDSYETAWNAWNIIQKFLLPDTSQMLCIDKKLCRDVLSEYQTQSRDLKHNHIDEALFDDIIQEIGMKIAQNIKDRQSFTIAFEKYVIDVQQKDALQYHPPQSTKPKRPQSAKAIQSTKDLIHSGHGDVNGDQKKIERPQSAIPMNAKKICSKKLADLMIDPNEVNVMSVPSEDEDEDKEEMKYCLDGIIDEM